MRLYCLEDGPKVEVILGEDGKLHATKTTSPEMFRGSWWSRLRVVGSTCILCGWHEGPHQWVPDQDIVDLPLL